MSNAKNTAVIFTVCNWLAESPAALHRDGFRSAVEVREDGTYRAIVVDTNRREVTQVGRFTRSTATDMARFMPGAA